MHRKLVQVSWAVVSCVVILSAGADDFPDATAYLASQLEPKISERVRARLSDSGLAPSDIESIASKSAIGIAKCQIAELEKLGEDGERVIADLAAQKPMEEIEEPRHVEVDTQSLRACVAGIELQLGIPLL